MNTYWMEPITLSREQFIQLTDALRKPDKEYMDSRNVIFEQMDERITIKRNGRDMEVEIPDLDLSFIDEEKKPARAAGYMIGCRASVSSRMRTVESEISYETGSIDWSGIEFTMPNQNNINQVEQYVTEKDRCNLLISCETEQIIYAA